MYPLLTVAAIFVPSADTATAVQDRDVKNGDHDTPEVVLIYMYPKPLSATRFDPFADDAILLQNRLDSRGLQLTPESVLV